MPNVLIISPDPETRRALELALELKGVSVTRGNAVSADAVVIDLVGEDHLKWKNLLAVSKKNAALRGAKTVVVLPHGSFTPKILQTLDYADLIVKRPFELFDVIEKISSIVGKKSKGMTMGAKKSKKTARQKK